MIAPSDPAIPSGVGRCCANDGAFAAITRKAREDAPNATDCLMELKTEITACRRLLEGLVAISGFLLKELRAFREAPHDLPRS